MVSTDARVLCVGSFLRFFEVVAFRATSDLSFLCL